MGAWAQHSMTYGQQPIGEDGTHADTLAGTPIMTLNPAPRPLRCNPPHAEAREGCRDFGSALIPSPPPRTHAYTALPSRFTHMPTPGSS
eukprot:211511-Chlamydomonas_euryale.AAC.1